MLTFVDDYLWNVWVHFIKHKSKVPHRFKKFKTLIKKQSDKQIKCQKPDNTIKFYGKYFTKFCKKEEMARHHTIQHHNQERAGCMILHAQVGKKCWVDVVNMTCYLINQSPSSIIT